MIDTEMNKEALVLEIDGCYVDSEGIQHYTFPREAVGWLSGNELAIAEYYWHIRPEWQGQWQDGVDEATPNWDELFDTVDANVSLGRKKTLFPRNTFLNYIGDDHNSLAYCEYRWYLNQT